MCPSRDELLAIVRKHSKNLSRTIEESLEDDDQGDSRFWREMLDMFFVRGVASSQATADDLLFFVHFMSFEYGGLNEQGKIYAEPCFVRRWQSELAKVIGDRSWEVDWRRSFYLNLVAHTTYTLSVSICSREELQRYKNSPGTALEPIYKITKRVFASPSRSNFQSKSSKASETISSYPNIYFSIDDYDEAFENLILKDEDHCYCVLLHATGGAAVGFKRSTEQDGSASSTVTLFSGFVNYSIVRASFESGKVSFGFLHFGAKSERLVMQGPGGRGEVDVIVTRVKDSNEEPDTIHHSPVPSEKPSSKLGIGTIVRRAAVAAKQAYLQAASSGNEDDVTPLRCSLLSVSLDWETLAHDLLFKGI